MSGCLQDATHHPEGDCLRHSFHVCDAAADIAIREGLGQEARAVLVLAALCHDMGKPSTTIFEDGRWRSPGHAEAGVPIAGAFLDSIGCLARIKARVLPLVREHMVPYWDGVTKRLVRRLKLRLGDVTITELLRLVEADRSGRPPHPRGLPADAAKIAVLDSTMPARVEPILMGRHLLPLGWEPGPAMGAFLGLALDAQVEGDFEDLEGALEWARSHAEDRGAG
jgi:tRNA nucleotidyltransferase (CCA-adding enzyme)